MGSCWSCLSLPLFRLGCFLQSENDVLEISMNGCFLKSRGHVIFSVPVKSFKGRTVSRPEEGGTRELSRVC